MILPSSCGILLAVSLECRLSPTSSWHDVTAISWVDKGGDKKSAYSLLKRVTLLFEMLLVEEFGYPIQYHLCRDQWTLYPLLLSSE